jgi:hypothetical protein
MRRSSKASFPALAAAAFLRQALSRTTAFWRDMAGSGLGASPSQAHLKKQFFTSMSFLCIAQSWAFEKGLTDEGRIRRASASLLSKDLWFCWTGHRSS